MIHDLGANLSDADFQSGSLDAVAVLLSGLGFRASPNEASDLAFLTSSAGGNTFVVFAPEASADHSWFIFTAHFPGSRFTLSQANQWNSQSLGVVAILDGDGDVRLNYALIRSDITVGGFARNFALWVHMLERFGSELRASK